jgi:hypothetical protein
LDEDEEFGGIHIFVPWGMRNENLMRTPRNGDPGVPTANPTYNHLSILYGMICKLIVQLIIQLTILLVGF